MTNQFETSDQYLQLSDDYKKIIHKLTAAKFLHPNSKHFVQNMEEKNMVYKKPNKKNIEHELVPFLLTLNIVHFNLCEL